MAATTSPRSTSPESVIDPEPSFDPREFEDAEGDVRVHLRRSLDVVPELGPADVALLDGDHNHYTVLNELRLLQTAARDAGAPTPVMLCHDVAWPYGRRDLYCDPDTIPAESRHPWARAGIVPGQSELSDAGGLNAAKCNATHEGGAANGVLTAVEDFATAAGEAIEITVLPVLHGLAILVPLARRERHPALGPVVDRWRTVEGWAELAALAELARCRSDIVIQAAGSRRAKIAALAADRKR